MDGRSVSKPPLPHRLRRLNRTLKQRERDVPDVDWEHSLQHFAAAVSHDLDELHSRFVHQNDLTFATWKRLWKDARISAAFHVEFWESTPTNTHKTILQQTLDGLVWCIEEHDGEFETSVDVAALIGRVFAMYCAYSVQLGSPKHKIDVDPQAWTALLTINGVMTGVGAKLYPLAARQVRAMMHQLVAQENAFVRCLQGFGPSVRATNTTRRAKSATRSENSIVTGTTTEATVIVDRSSIERLNTLNDRYQELKSRARSGPSVSRADARLSSRRAKPMMGISLTFSSGETENDGQALARALTSYMEYKANEAIRQCDRVVRAATIREQETQNMLSLTPTDCNILNMSTCGSVMSRSSSVRAGSVTPSRRSRDSKTEMVKYGPGIQTTFPSSPTLSNKRKLPWKSTKGYNGKDSSEISEADSGVLADLERELEQSVSVLSSQTRVQKTAIPETTVTRRKRGRNSLAASAAKPESSVLPTKRARSNSVTSRLSFKDSWRDVSSIADSDALATLQAELDATPAVSDPQNSTTPLHSSFEVQSSTAKLSKANVKPKPASRQVATRARESRKTPPIQCPPAHSRTVSESSELLAQLQAELNLTAESAVSGPRRSTRLSSIVSQNAGHASKELEEKRSTRVAITEAVSPLAFAEMATNMRGKAGSKRDTQPLKRSTRSSAKMRFDEVATSAVDQSATAQKEDRMHHVVRSDPVALQQSSSLSSTSSDTESDGLADLVAELNTTTTAMQTSRQLHPENSSVAHVRARWVGLMQSAASVNRGTSRPNEIRSIALGLRRSARISSLASDSKSDGLEDLLAELERDPNVGSVATNTEKMKPGKPRVRSGNVSNRGQSVKLRQNQAKATSPDVATKHVKSRRSGNLPSSRRSTRSSSVAFESDSDGLAELEAELQAGLV